MTFKEAVRNWLHEPRGEPDEKAAGDQEAGVKRARTSSLEEWHTLASFLGIGDVESDAMSEATYCACMKIMREAIGKMPLRLLQRTDSDGVRTAYDHPLYNVLCKRPNPYMPATLFWACVEQNRNHYGNAYLRITGTGMERDPYQLWIMPFEEVDVWYDNLMILSDVPDIYYRWSHGGRMYVLKSYEVIHLRTSDTFDGVMGIPVIDRLKLEVDGAIGSQRFQNELITSGMTAKAVLQYTGNLEPEAVKTFASNIEKYAKGDFAKEGVKQVIPIPIGAQITPLNIKLTDAQFMELKKYNAVQIASAFGIKPMQIGDMTKQSYASSLAQQEAFYTDTLLYPVRQYEEETAYKLLSEEEERRGYFCEFDTSVVLRSDFKTMVEACAKAVDHALLTPNEARQMLKQPHYPGADTLLGNGNLVPIENAGIQYTQEVQEPEEDPPDPEPAEEDPEGGDDDE